MASDTEHPPETLVDQLEVLGIVTTPEEKESVRIGIAMSRDGATNAEIGAAMAERGFSFERLLEIYETAKMALLRQMLKGMFDKPIMEL